MRLINAHNSLIPHIRRGEGLYGVQLSAPQRSVFWMLASYRWSVIEMIGTNRQNGASVDLEVIVASQVERTITE